LFPPIPCAKSYFCHCEQGNPRADTGIYCHIETRNENESTNLPAGCIGQANLLSEKTMKRVLIGDGGYACPVCPQDSETNSMTRLGSCQSPQISKTIKYNNLQSLG
jgi:hypothetical protein